MAENFEFEKENEQLDRLFTSPLVSESMEMSQLTKGSLDNGVADNQDVCELSTLSELNELALQEAIQSIRLISQRVQNLPLEIRKELLGSISDMTGNEFPAYDTLRLSLAKS